MKKKKISFDVANNGREAVDKWRTGGYHLILVSGCFGFVLHEMGLVTD
jgi:hypothetical protein